MTPALLVLLACGLDRLLGDPLWWPHPVQAMGWAIGVLRRAVEAWAGDVPRRLRLGGALLALVVIAGSGLAGWGIEALARRAPLVGTPLLLLGLASALAGGSLARAVRAVLVALPDVPLARARLARIVGRQVSQLPEAEILRAAAETAAENAVDGLFAPLFWMLVGAALQLGPALPALPLPGPLALAWSFKAASTLDSMLGYRHGRLRWLGTAGARLDDLLTWLPARLVALTLPLAAGHPGQTLRLFRAALRDGAPDPSPNAGVSEAAFAHAAGVRLGGANTYADGVRIKPILAAAGRAPDADAVERILALGDRLQRLWLLVALPALWALSATAALQ
ncbi:MULTISPECIES: adenosylcobinamide-phosphate synthase CbiB [unclassified Cyanobium]|uniref:adenosylcobinamide-phosphate synthase CbiB n=1 Tax=unclassified Cyanobium TaxID=2627006 RepID=UPI0020CFCCCC|nr:MULTISPECIES: adenosylcobinamide-phosphate synthase CbiB [unclassified Cyanobium]MCP9859988.1 cobalamin biosynthesis protein CobD [Cyanobium sp. Cruz-8H5]MCP9867176.1 cobalamin biosynthesis protein CobD [Cyanobium sp. Cruz-8D1]